MANRTITSLPAGVTVTDDQIFESVEGGVSVKYTGAQIKAYVASTLQNKNGSGSPVGSVTPNYIGQTYTDTTPPYGFWTSIGLTNNDWIPVLA